MAETVGERWLIAGQVQGVGYRAWMVEQARMLGLDGWVRNRADGQVEAVVAGAAKALAQLRQVCRQGPAGARVIEIKVAVEPECSLPETNGFSQAATYLGQG